MRSRTLTLAALPLALLACADFVRGDYWSQQGESDTGVEGEYGYAADVHVLLDAGCARCHAPGESAGNTDFILTPEDTDASYELVLEFVDLDSPADSRLLSKSAGQGHQGGTIFDTDSPEYDLMLAWIQQGAPP